MGWGKTPEAHPHTLPPIHPPACNGNSTLDAIEGGGSCLFAAGRSGKRLKIPVGLCVSCPSVILVSYIPSTCVPVLWFLRSLPLGKVKCLVFMRLMTGQSAHGRGDVSISHGKKIPKWSRRYFTEWGQSGFALGKFCPRLRRPTSPLGHLMRADCHRDTHS